ncbi:ubiquinol-cytochrome-c reductase complex assembly factor 1 isoform X2 [Alligator mississippiensis]|uniref:Ubiquinol-cytochrome c reductase complex chaperone n=1 Tax=Alligator mississippiensis TaxID=8496 RepID=A0A151NVR4_ALLMI|nr:ubiquinol-cytochrome-c reductase complex assembly factor 1 isoform X2 [Alligator mississippiensis]KYO40967.1 ubiquinol-cytochrome c reductase complex chaperone [Alligator mississippiensis]
MAALVRAAKHLTGMTDWITGYSGLFQMTLGQGKWERKLYSTSQRHTTGQFQLTKVQGGLMQTNSAITQQSRILHNTNKLFATQDSLQPYEERVSFFTKMIGALGFTGPLKYNKWKIKLAALRMYTSCVERTDYEEFFERFNMPDTLNSWFLVAQLHVWMCLVRMKQEGRTGTFMCHHIVHFMWDDVKQRGKMLGIDPSTLRRSMRSMTENFYAAIYGYDEGILSDDHVLAAALWRNLFNKNCEDPRQLELLVEYVRKQMQYLDAMNGDDLLLSGEVTWRPLVEYNAQSILRLTSPVYNDEGL